ncbi:hypothetical protein BB561_004512 [Smittium simulii]|uniref:GPI inositol-deacylase n=1 Tax=Smittium simulii TaxID=133385 RepID=A0A2T9YG19_9FUNG|nr:hypothetical protein BB561_004512 [Smittium simulii]
MTYMHPSYILQTDFQDSGWTKYHKKYSLYLYRDSVFDTEPQPYRVPVLFIPGNSGSHRQVRSLAYASAKFHENILKYKPNIHENGVLAFDFFTIDTNEELSALHGTSLLEQAHYVNDVLSYLVSLYSKNRAQNSHLLGLESLPKVESIIIIGHSMGGMIARTAITLPNYVPNSIKTIITLSTPHTFPTVNLDSKVSNIYKNVNLFWSKFDSNPIFNDLIVVSIAGGNMDKLVNSDLSFIGDIVPSYAGLSTLTSSMRNVWLSADHQSILWCCQFVRSLARALADIVDVRRSSQTKPADERLRMFKNRFSSGSLGLEDKDLKATGLSGRLHYNDTFFSSNGFNQFDNTTYYSINHTKSHFKLLYSDTGNTKGYPTIHLINNTNSKLLGIKSKTKKLQILMRSTKLEVDSTRGIEYLHFLCCNPQIAISEQINKSSNNHFFTVNDKSMGKFTCSWLPRIRAAALMGDDLEHINEIQFAEIESNHFNQCSNIGLFEPAISSELKRHTGQMRASFVDLRLVDADSTEDTNIKPSLSTLIFAKYSVFIKSPEFTSKISGKKYSIRSRITLNVPDHPFFEYKVKITSVEKHLLGTKRWAPLSIRQTDDRGFENRYWSCANEARVSIHGHSSYIFSQNLKTSTSEWKGIYVDIFSLKFPKNGSNIY